MSRQAAASSALRSTQASEGPRLLKFATVGGITTAIDFVMFGVLSGSMGFAAASANICSYSCGIVASFILNAAWTFKGAAHRGNVASQALRFGVSNAIGLILSTLLVVGFAMVLPDLVAKLISVPIVFLWNYAASRLWVFR